MSKTQYLLDAISLHASRAEDAKSKLNEKPANIEDLVHYRADFMVEYHRMVLCMKELEEYFAPFDEECRTKTVKLADDNRIPRGVIADSYGGCIHISESVGGKKNSMDLERLFKDCPAQKLAWECKAQANAKKARIKAEADVKKAHDETTWTFTDASIVFEHDFAPAKDQKAKGRAKADKYRMPAPKKTVIATYANANDCRLYVQGIKSEED